MRWHHVALFLRGRLLKTSTLYDRLRRVFGEAIVCLGQQTEQEARALRRDDLFQVPTGFAETCGACVIHTNSINHLNC